MALDLSMLPTADLEALRAGDIGRVSTSTLMTLKRHSVSSNPNTPADMRIPGNEISTAMAEKPASLRDKVASVVDVPAALASGLVGGVAAPIAGVVGTIASGKYGTPEGITAGNEAAMRAQQAFYRPRTQTGANVLQSLGKVMNDSGLIAVAPLAGEVSSLARSAPSAVRAFNDSVRPEAQMLGATVRDVGSVITQPIGSAARSVSEKLLNSALKPTLGQHDKGLAKIAVDTMLQEGVNATPGGVRKLQTMIGEKNRQIASALANSNATVSRTKVAGRLSDPGGVVQKFANQVDPMPDINAIGKVVSGFESHPFISADAIPVQSAQKLKQGTYRVLAKKYGEMKGAEVEAQKALARGLKDEIAAAVPDVAGLNAAESKLLTTLDVVERRALMDLNKNPGGLSWLSHSPATWAAFMADKSALFKSLAARMVNSAGNAMTISPSKGGLLSRNAPVPAGLLANPQPYSWQTLMANQTAPLLGNQ